MTGKVLTSLALAALLSLAVGARASTISLTLTGISPKMSESVTFNGGETITTSVGAYNWSVGPNDAPALVPSSALATYCIEGTQSVSVGHTYAYDVLGPGQGAYTAVFSHSNLVSALFNQYYNVVQSAVGSTQKNEYNAAFQLAIWELVNDGLSDKPKGGDVNDSRWFTDGDFQIKHNSSIGPGHQQHHGGPLSDFSASEVNTAETWLNQLNVNATGTYTVYQLSECNHQDQVFAVLSGSNQTSVPEPLSAITLAAGMAVLLRRPR